MLDLHRQSQKPAELPSRRPNCSSFHFTQWDQQVGVDSHSSSDEFPPPSPDDLPVDGEDVPRKRVGPRFNAGRLESRAKRTAILHLDAP